MTRFVVTGRLRAGAAPTVADILRHGPPFDLGETSLERHEVYLGEDELVFLFDGPHAEAEARRLLSEPRVLDRAGRIATYLERPPRFPRGVFTWERPHQLDGVVFGPFPGPGDSDGGDAA